MFAGLRKSLEALDAITPNVVLNKEIKSLFDQLNRWHKILNFLKDPYLVSRWGALIVAAALFFVYAYFALLFSFCYHAIAYLGGGSYPWPDALVTSVFIPFLVGDLPKQPITLLLLGGVHCTLILAIGVGTITNFFRRKLNDIRMSAEDMSNVLADQCVREKYLILEQCCKEQSAG